MSESRWLLPLLSLVPLSCGERLLSDSGRLEIRFRDLHLGPLIEMDASHPVLVGSRLCPSLHLSETGEDVSACYRTEVDGQALDPEGCATVRSEGALGWRFLPEPSACDRPELSAEETLTLEAVGPEGIEASIHQWPEEWAEASLLGDFPSDWIDLDRRPLRVAVGGSYSASVVLSRDGVAVAWNPSLARWRVEAGRGRPPLASGSGDGAVTVTAAEPGQASLLLELGELSFPVAEVEGVPLSELVSLELAVAWQPTDGGRVPSGARAVIRSEEGLVYGAPVSWSVRRGALGLFPGGDLPGFDYARLQDGCREEEAPGEAVLRAELGRLGASADLSWDGRGDPLDPGDCSAGGCGCRTGSGAGSLALVALIALLSRRRRSLGAPLLLVGCGPDLRVVETRELGPLAWTEAVAGRDGGSSTRWGDRSVWMFGDSVMRRAGEDGSSWRNNTVCSTADLYARDGLGPFDEALDGIGVPGEFLPMTEEERRYEQEHSGPGCGEDCSNIALWPGAQVWDPDRGRLILFYAKYVQRPGFLNLTGFGTSLALWEDGAPSPVRPELRPGTDEPTILFPDPEQVELAAASAIDGDHLYAFSCTGRFHRCGLLRAPLDRATEPEAWRFWAGGKGWVEEADRMDRLFVGSTIMDVHWNPHLGRWLAIYSTPLGEGIDLRTAKELTGPWSDAETVHRPVAPVPDTWTYSALGHGELMLEDGRFEYLTYYLDYDGSMRLVEVEFEGGG